MSEAAVSPSDPGPGGSAEGNVGPEAAAPQQDAPSSAGEPSSPAPDPGSETGSFPSVDAPAAPKAPPIASLIPGLDPDTLNHPALQNVKDPADLAKQFVHLQSLIGKKSVPIPGEDATADDWNQFYSNLGRPESSEKYSFVQALDPEVREQAQQFLGPILETFHQAGLTDEQATAVATNYLKTSADQFEARQQAAAQAVQASETALRQKWGAAYDAKLNAAAEAADTLFGENINQFKQIQLADGTFLGDNPLMIELLSALGEANYEGAIHPGGSRATMTPDEAAAELQAMMSDPDAMEAYKNRDHPQHKAVLARRLDLRRMANPDQGQRNLYDPIGL